MVRKTALVFVALLVALVGGGYTAALAQQRPDPPDRTEAPPPQQVERSAREQQGWLERSIDFWGDLRARGIRPRFGGLGAGSGIAVGAEIRRESFFAPNLGVSLSGSVSVRGYQAYDARIGRVSDWSDRTVLQTADTEPAAGISLDRNPTPGFSAYVHARQRIRGIRADLAAP